MGLRCFVGDTTQDYRVVGGRGFSDGDTRVYGVIILTPDNPSRFPDFCLQRRNRESMEPR